MSWIRMVVSRKETGMSASNAAVPNPAANASLTLELNATPESRRRVAVTEKKSSVDNDGNMNDLNRKIRGQSLHERPKNITEVKRGLVASPIGPRRRKGIPKPEKLKWQTFVSVVTKICLLLVAVLWLGQLIWRWEAMIRYNRDFSSLDSESRLFEVETSMKSVAKMLQVQVDVVEKKIFTEVGFAKRELKKQVEEKDLMFEEELKRLVSQTDNLDKSLAELKGMGFLLKEEFRTFLDKSKGRNLGSSNHDVTLDDVRNFAKEIVKKEIEKHAADGLGRVDYALSSGGARVISHSEPFVVGKFSNWLSLGKGRNRVHSNAQKMLEPSFGEPGQCFALQGNNGFVEIRLRTGIVAEAVTLEHVSKSIAYDRSSAPKDCMVSAWFEEPGSDPSKRAEKTFILMKFSYDLEKSNAQTFKVETAISGIINIVRLDFSSNHGSSTLTCIYRFRVHGYEPNFTSKNTSE
ncbi:SUN domain-containing protein 1-like isoform X1 [Musa acuminata AAA Group]|uniref:SUN domain-containing protein 1-like isoform X1 n=2 Tax=Musa acuminata AAA Group TaxID=214697 RepID=UPI0031DA4C0F